MPQSRIVICGVGLIGGSFALALKKAALALGRDLLVVGMGRTRAPLEQALQLGVIDAIATDWASALDGADLVLLGMPVGQMAAVMEALAPHLQPHTIVTDGGSTKSDVVAAARAALGDKVRQFVPGHPIAGAEKSGVAAAQADLYVDKRVVLTPLPENSADDVKAVRMPGSFAARRCRNLRRTNMTAFSRRSATCPTCWPSPWCTISPNGRTLTSCSASLQAASAISRASPAAIRKCGATSASPTAMRCCRNSTPT
jgi:hypothetical protein